MSDVDITVAAAAIDGWLGLPWSREKWQLSHLIRGGELEFDRSETRMTVINAEFDVLSPDISTSTVDGEYAEVQVGSRAVHVLRVGFWFVIFVPRAPEKWSEPIRASLRGTYVVHIGSMANLATSVVATHEPYRLSSDAESDSGRSLEAQTLLRRLALVTSTEGLSELVIDAITLGGGQVLTSPAGNEFAVAVWAEGFEATVANPLAISPILALGPDWRSVQTEVGSWLLLASLQTALVVYKHGPESSTLPMELSSVLPLRADEFVRAVADVGIVELAVHLRNRAQESHVG